MKTYFEIQENYDEEGRDWEPITRSTDEAGARRLAALYAHELPSHEYRIVKVTREVLT